jgi:hypothetical protein
MSPRHPAPPIPRRSPEQDHNTSRKLLDSFIEPLQSLYTGTSSPWQSRLPPPRVTVRNISPAVFHPLQSPGKLLCYPQNLATIEHFSSLILFTAGVHFPPVLLHNQSYPKVCSDSLNLPNAGNPLCRNIVLIFLFSIFPYQGLNCFDLECSRMFSVNFPKPSLFQISELLLELKVFDLWSRLNIRK